MNKRINELIPKALEAISDSQIAKNGIVAREYKGYISSMGASIIQSGLLATLAFYSNEQSQAEKKRLNLLKAIKLLIASESNVQIRLLDYILSNTNNGDNKPAVAVYEKSISEALIALKLALRTFKQEK